MGRSVAAAHPCCSQYIRLCVPIVRVGVSSEPDHSVVELTDQDCFIILASDGVWEFITSKEAVDIVAQCDSAEEACRQVGGAGGLQSQGGQRKSKLCGSPNEAWISTPQSVGSRSDDILSRQVSRAV
jgi:hypothetical protein